MVVLQRTAAHHCILFQLQYISLGTRGITPPQPQFANLHAVVAMPEGWHGSFDYIRGRAGFCQEFMITERQRTTHSKN